MPKDLSQHVVKVGKHPHQVDERIYCLFIERLVNYPGDARP